MTFRILSLLALLAFVACENKQKKNTTEPLTPEQMKSPEFKPTKDRFPVITFDQNFKKLGKINEGDTLVQRFTFKNTGNMPLVINYCSASCGCTQPRWPQYPVQPGDTSSIITIFNSKNREGMQRKTITIYANTVPEQNEVGFLVEVLKVSAKKP
jgi:Protein of unknown function (DUF1573)